MSETLGPTGQFPDGLIAPGDEGEIQFRVGVTISGEIILDFGTPVVWIGMSPDQADAVGTMLKNAAEKARTVQQ